MERQQGKIYREKMKKLCGRGLLRGKEDEREEINEERGKKLGKMRRKKIMRLEYGKEEEDEQE
jgi:hypothetical protein